MHKKKLWWGKTGEYTPLKYLEGTGTQYIDTGIKADLNTKAEIAFCFPNASTTAGSGRVFGSRGSSVLNGFGIGSYSGTIENGTILTVYYSNGNTASSQTTTTITVGQQYVTYISKDLISQNGFKETGTSTDAFETPRTLKLFGFENNTDAIVCGKVQISSCRIIQDNVLIRDMIPVLDKNKNPCFWDRVNDKLYYNQGTGDFSYKEWDYTPCDCVYANGNAYTRTMLYGNSDTKMEMLFDITVQSTQNRGIMGSRGNSANSQLLAIGYGTSVLASDFNNSSYSPYRASIDYDLNKKYRVYTSKEKRSIIDEDTGTVLAENNTLCSNNMSTGALLLGAETGLSYRHTGNIYGAKVWDGSLLTRDYIPVVDGDNKGGFYDKCLNIISYSVGTSDFVGHFVENGVDYKVVKNIIASQVATSGNTNACPYIKTGIYPSTSKKTRMKAKAQIAVVDTSYDHFLGGTNADSRFVFGQAIASSSSMFYFGLGTQNYWTNKTVDTSLHIFGLDWATETCSIDDTTWQIPSAGTSESTKSFFINARSISTHDNANRPAGGTSYWWKFWEDKKLVYNGIPVIRTNDSKVGLFETINRQFQTTAGTVEYTYTA